MTLNETGFSPQEGGQMPCPLLDILAPRALQQRRNAVFSISSKGKQTHRTRETTCVPGSLQGDVDGRETHYIAGAHDEEYNPQHFS